MLIYRMLISRFYCSRRLYANNNTAKSHELEWLCNNAIICITYIQLHHSNSFIGMTRGQPLSPTSKLVYSNLSTPASKSSSKGTCPTRARSSAHPATADYLDKVPHQSPASTLARRNFISKFCREDTDTAFGNKTRLLKIHARIFRKF